MEEESVGLLEFVEVSGHLQRATVAVLDVIGRAEGLHLDRGDHEHVVDPETGLFGEAVGSGVLPLLVGVLQAQVQVLLVIGLDEQLKRDGAKDRGVHMHSARGKQAGFLRRQQGVETLDQPGGEVLIAGHLREGQASVPSADLRVNDAILRHVRARDEALRHTLADFRGRLPRGPTLEFPGLSCVQQSDKQDHQHRRDSQQRRLMVSVHLQLSPLRFQRCFRNLSE